MRFKCILSILYPIKNRHAEKPHAGINILYSYLIRKEDHPSHLLQQNRLVPQEPHSLEGMEHP